MDSCEEEIPQPLCPEKKLRVDGEALFYSPTQAVAVAKVLDDDNLLIEILLRISFPTTLVRAAAVCKRWLHHASCRKFLSRFRELHPPRLLGFYHNRSTSPRFVPMLPQPPELAAAIRRSSCMLDDDSQSADVWTYIMDSRGGSVFTGCRDKSGLTLIVRSVLCPARGVTVVPPFPRDKPQDGYLYTYSTVLSTEEGDGGLSYFYVYMESGWSSDILVQVYVLQDGVWRMHASAATEHNTYFLNNISSLIFHNKIYLVADGSRGIMVLDLKTSSFSTILLPQGVRCDQGPGYDGRYTVLSRSDDCSAVYLVHSDGLHKLWIWLHNGDKWLLVDTIGLLDICDDTLDTCVDVHISHVADNAEFMFLAMGQCTLHLDVKSRTVRKVLETDEGLFFDDVYPFMMIWPPTFPALKDDDPAREHLDGQ